MTDDITERSHRESAELLGLDPDKLTAGGRLKCELVSALRACVDDALAKVTRGTATDLAKLVAAVEQLTAMMKQSPAGDQERDEDDEEGDPRARMVAIVQNWIDAHNTARCEQGLSTLMPDLPTAQRRIDQLEAENARLRGEEPKALPSPESDRVIDPPTGDIVPPGEWRGVPPMPGPDDHKVMRPKPVIDHAPTPQAAPPRRYQPGPITEAEARAQGLRPAGGEPWRPYVDSGSGFIWGGDKGRAW